MSTKPNAERLLITLPDPDDGYSDAKIARKNLAHGSIRVIIDTDPNKKGGYQLKSDGFCQGEIEVPAGACLGWQNPRRQWRIGIVLPDATIAWRIGWTLGTKMPTIRKIAEAIVDDPLSEIEQIIEERREDLSEKQAAADAKREERKALRKADELSHEHPVHSEIKNAEQATETARRNLQSLLKSYRPEKPQPPQPAAIPDELREILLNALDTGISQPGKKKSVHALEKARKALLKHQLGAC